MTGSSKGQKAPSRGCRRFCVFLAVHVHGVLNGIIIYYAVLPLKIRFGIFFFWRLENAAYFFYANYMYGLFVHICNNIKLAMEFVLCYSPY